MKNWIKANDDRLINLDNIQCIQLCKKAINFYTTDESEICSLYTKTFESKEQAISFFEELSVFLEAID